MKNLKIGRKFFMTFSFMLLFFVVSLAMAVASLHVVANEFVTFYQGPYRTSAQTEKMCQQMDSAEKNLALSMLLESPEEVQKHASLCEEDFAALNQNISSLAETVLDNQNRITELTTILSDASMTLQSALTLSRQNSWEQAADLYEAELKPKLDQARLTLNTVNSESSANADAFFSTAMGTKKIASILTILSGIANLVFAVFLAIRLTNYMTRPIYEIEAATMRIASGDLDAQVSYQSRDELGSLANVTRQMMHTFRTYIRELSENLVQIASGNFDICISQEYQGEFVQLKDSVEKISISMSQTLKEIRQTAEQVSSGSEQVSGGAQSLSQGATEQASAIEEIASTIHEISSQVEKNAENSAEASQKASAVEEQMIQSNQQMQSMTEAMDQIRTSSSEIGKIVKTIEDIAFQTNILALNAAVEAARAGAAGKGFAVVADEVRNLANKSAEASKNTTVLIEGSMQSVEMGAKIANETAQTLTAAVAGAQQVAETIHEISSASEEQAVSISQLQQGISQISTVVLTNSATAEQSASASEQLSDQAHSLNALVSQFQLKEDTAFTRV